MKKIRRKSGEYRRERKERIKSNEENISTLRSLGRWNRYKRFRIHTWFIAYQKQTVYELKKEGEELQYEGMWKL